MIQFWAWSGGNPGFWITLKYFHYYCVKGRIREPLAKRRWWRHLANSFALAEVPAGYNCLLVFLHVNMKWNCVEIGWCLLLQLIVMTVRLEPWTTCTIARTPVAMCVGMTASISASVYRHSMWKHHRLSTRHPRWCVSSQSVKKLRLLMSQWCGGCLHQKWFLYNRVLLIYSDDSRLKLLVSLGDSYTYYFFAWIIFYSQYNISNVSVASHCAEAHS